MYAKKAEVFMNIVKAQKDLTTVAKLMRGIVECHKIVLGDMAHGRAKVSGVKCVLKNLEEISDYIDLVAAMHTKCLKEIRQ